MQIIGAGLGRTGTTSLKIALQLLTGKPSYHMADIFENPSHIEFWHSKATGETVDWNRFFASYGSAIDWPAAAFWPELMRVYPEAKVLLSERDPESWWKSANRTIFPKILQATGPWREMMDSLFAKHFTLALTDKTACIAAYQRNTERVLDEVPAQRLIRWQAEDGWKPICEALGVDKPNQPFPKANTTEDFLKS
jgi:hypothetical protein